jgi:hypothetical protein
MAYASKCHTPKSSIKPVATVTKENLGSQEAAVTAIKELEGLFL